MSVSVDRHSAARLLAEGAICFDTDSREASCNGLPVRLPSGSDEIVRPILVCGTSATVRRAIVAHLEDLGLPAWEVVNRH